MVYFDQLVITFLIDLRSNLKLKIFFNFFQILMMLPLIKNSKIGQKFIFENPTDCDSEL